jgi:hypothetical protein
MLHVFTGPAQWEMFQRTLHAQSGCALSPRAAAVVLHCSPEHVCRLVATDELEAWSYHAREGGPAQHYRVAIP